ncbi:NAD(P)-binding domain-containing protein, partial [Pseudonocardia sp. 73-21]
EPGPITRPGLRDKPLDVATGAGAEAAADNVEAVRGAEVIVLAVPHAAVAGIAKEIADLVGDAVVVDSTNPLNDTYTGLTTEGVSAAEELQGLLPAAHVVKAFNTVFAGRHADPAEDGTPLDAFIAGDDAAAKTVVAGFAGSLGYRPIDVGGLRMARALEEMAFLNISLNANNGLPWQSAWKLVGPTEAVR